MDRICRLVHVVQPALFGKVVHIPPLRHHPAMAVTAAPGLAHIESHLVFSVGAVKVKVGGEHGGGHVAQLRPHDVPGAGVQLLFHPVVGELDYTAGHILILVAGIPENTTQPGIPLAKFRNVPLVEELLHVQVAGGRHVHHIGDLTDRAGPLFKIRFQDPHDLEQIGAKGCNLPHGILVGLLLRDQFPPHCLHTFAALQLVQ